MTDVPPGPEAPAPATRRSHFVDLTPLRVSPPFARLWFGNTLAGIGTFVTNTAVGLHIYDLTRSTFMVSLVAWFSLLPMIVAGLYGGAIADRFDRRAVALSASTVAWASTVVLATIVWLGAEQVWMFYVITTVNAVAATIASATRQAITPRLLPKEQLPKAAALLGISAGVMVTVGPGIAGVLVARAGYAWTYTVDVVLFFAGFFGLWTLPRIRPEGERPTTGGFRSVVDGLAHLRRAPNVRMSFIVDIIAMTFGQPMVLFPAVGAIVIGGGSVTAGILLASFAVGGIVSSLGSGASRAALAGSRDPQRDRLLRPRHPRLRRSCWPSPSSAATPCSRWTSATPTGGPSRSRPCASPWPAGPTTSARSSGSRSCRPRCPTTCAVAPRASSRSSSRADRGSVRCSPGRSRR